MPSLRAVAVTATIQIQKAVGTSVCHRFFLSLEDLLDVGLIDASWPKRFEPKLAQRLQLLIDNLQLIVEVINDTLRQTYRQLIKPADRNKAVIVSDGLIAGA